MSDKLKEQRLPKRTVKTPQLQAIGALERDSDSSSAHSMHIGLMQGNFVAGIHTPLRSIINVPLKTLRKSVKTLRNTLPNMGSADRHWRD